MHTCMVLLRGNVALAHECLLRKRHRSIEFCVLIHSQDTQSCKLLSTPAHNFACTYALYMMVLVAETNRRVATQLVKCELSISFL